MIYVCVELVGGGLLVYNLSHFTINWDCETHMNKTRSRDHRSQILKQIVVAAVSSCPHHSATAEDSLNAKIPPIFSSMIIHHVIQAIM